MTICRKYCRHKWLFWMKNVIFCPLNDEFGGCSWTPRPQGCVTLKPFLCPVLIATELTWWCQRGDMWSQTPKYRNSIERLGGLRTQIVTPWGQVYSRLDFILDIIYISNYVWLFSIFYSSLIEVHLHIDDLWAEAGLHKRQRRRNRSISASLDKDHKRKQVILVSQFLKEELLL